MDLRFFLDCISLYTHCFQQNISDGSPVKKVRSTNNRNPPVILEQKNWEFFISSFLCWSLFYFLLLPSLISFLSFSSLSLQLWAPFITSSITTQFLHPLSVAVFSEQISSFQTDSRCWLMATWARLNVRRFRSFGVNLFVTSLFILAVCTDVWLDARVITFCFYLHYLEWKNGDAFLSVSVLAVRQVIHLYLYVPKIGNSNQ